MGGRSSLSGRLDRRGNIESYDRFQGTPGYEAPEEDILRNIAWFANFSNNEELISAAENDDRYTKAIEGYLDGLFMDEEVWKGYENYSDTQTKYSRSMDELLDRFNNSKAFIVHRLSDFKLLGSREPLDAQQLASMEGQYIDLKSYLSASAASTGKAVSHDSVDYEIHIPANAKGAGMHIGDTRVNTGYTKELEFLVNRDSVMRIGKTSIDSRTGRAKVKLYWMGRQEHKYKGGK